MKKRIISTLLLLAMLVTAVPLAAFVAFATEVAPQAEAPEFTEEEYNALYVRDGMLLGLNFFRLNALWGKEVTIPEAPPEMTEYLFHGEKYDFTDPANRLLSPERIYAVKYGTTASYWMRDVKNGYISSTTPYTTFATEAEAEAFAATLKAAGKTNVGDVVTVSRWIIERYSANGASYSNYSTGDTWNGVTSIYFATQADALDKAQQLAGAGATLTAEGDAYKATNGMLYKVMWEPTANDAYRAAFTEHQTAVNALVSSFSILPAEKQALKFSQSLPAIGGRGHHTMDGSAVKSGVAFGNGYMIHNGGHSDSFLNLSGVPTSGNLHAEYVMSGGAKSYTNTALFILREIEFRASISGPDGTTLTGTCAYGNSETVGWKYIVPGGKQAPFTYAITLTPKTGGHNVLAKANGQEVYNGTVGDTNGGYTTSSLGYRQGTSASPEYYAIRIYNRTLSETEQAQNHFADLAKWFRLDLTPLALLAGDELAPVYAAVKDFTLQSDRDAVADAVLSAAQAAAAEKYASLDADLVAVAVQYGLNIDPLLSFPRGMLPATYAVLADIEGTADLRAAYDAAVKQDLSSPLEAGDYNALYVQDELVYALDFSSTNEHWSNTAKTGSYTADEAKTLINSYRWLGTRNYSFKYRSGASTVTLQDGYLNLATINEMNLANLENDLGRGLHGATAEEVRSYTAGGTIGFFMGVRATAAFPSGKISHINQGGASYNLLDEAPNATFADLTKVSTFTSVMYRPVPVVRVSGGGFTAQYQTYRDAKTPSDIYAQVMEDRDGDGTPETLVVDLGRVVYDLETYKSSSSDRTIWSRNFPHIMVKPAFVKNADGTYTENTDKKEYPVAIEPRKIEGEWNMYQNGNAVYLNDKATYLNTDYYDNHHFITLGGSGSAANNGGKLYFVRYYAKQLTKEEMAQNHFADMAKFFHLNLTGLDVVPAADIPAIYASLADYTVESDRYEVQRALTAAIVAAVAPIYESMKIPGDAAQNAFVALAAECLTDISAVFSAKRDMSSVYAADYSDSLSVVAMQRVVDEAYLDAYYYRSYMIAGQDDFNALLEGLATSDLMKGRDRLDTEALMTLPLAARLGVTEEADEILAAGTVAAAQAILDDYVKGALAAYPTGYGEKDAYNALYVDRGLLLAADFFDTNSYWGGTLDVPVGPSENTAYLYNGEKVDLTLDKNRYNGKWSINKLTNSWTRSRSTDAAGKELVFDSYEDAALAAYNLANGTSLTALPAGAASPFVSKDAIGGYPLYEVAHNDTSAAFKAASAEWLEADKATLDSTIWHTESYEDLYFFSYTKQYDARNYVRVVGAPTEWSAFRAGDGFITIREDLPSDGGLQTNAKLASRYGTDAMSTQVIAVLTDDIVDSTSTLGSTLSIFYNIRPLVKKTEDGTGMTLLKFSNFTPTTVLPATAVPFAGVKDMTYTATGLSANAGEDTFTLKIGQTPWIDVKGTYTGNNNNYKHDGTTYLGYGSNFGGMKIYALRYYSVDLTNAEIAQNHFADLAKFFRIDLEGYEVLDDAQRAALYASVADMTFENTTRAAVQAALFAVLSEAFAPTYDAAEGKIDAGFLAIARELALDISPILAIREVELRNAIVASVTDSFRAGHAMDVNVICAMLEEEMAFLDVLTFRGMSVRIHTGIEEKDMPGVRAQFVVDDALLTEYAGITAFGVHILKVNKATDETPESRVERATLTVYRDYTGTSTTVTGKSENISIKAGEDGMHEFAYTVIYSKPEVQTKEYYEAELAYRIFVVYNGKTYTRDIVTSFGETVSAAEVYTYFYENAGKYELVGEDGKIDSVVTAVYETLNPKAE